MEDFHTKNQMAEKLNCGVSTIEKNIKELMLFRPGNIPYILKLKKNIDEKLYNQVWPKPIEILKSYIYVMYNKIYKSREKS